MKGLGIVLLFTAVVIGSLRVGTVGICCVPGIGIGAEIVGIAYTIVRECEPCQKKKRESFQATLREEEGGRRKARANEGERERERERKGGWIDRNRTGQGST